MEANNLKYKIIFKLDENDSIGDAISTFNSFFSACCERKKIHCGIKCSNSVHIIEDLIYEEPEYEVQYALFLRERANSSTNLHAFDKDICRKWCAQERRLYYQLLIPVVDGLYGKLKQSHTDVRTLEFGFGSLPDFRHFVSHYRYKPSSLEPELMTSYDHSKRYFNLYFCLNHEEECSQPKTTHRFEVHYSSIIRVLIDFAYGEGHIHMFFYLSYLPPVFAMVRQFQEKGKNSNGDNGNDNASQQSTQKSLAYEQIYQQSKWERSLSFGCDCKDTACPVASVGRALVLKVVISDNDRGHDIIRRLRQRCFKSTEFLYARVETIYHKGLSDFENFSFLIRNERVNEDCQQSLFNCQYAWEALVSRSYDIHDQIFIECKQKSQFWNRLKNLMSCHQGSPDALASALFHIYNMMYTKNMIFSFENALKKLFAFFCQNKQIVDLPTGMCLARRVVITPSRRILLPPMEHFDNRVIRQYGIEYMLRVSIQDDSSNKLTFAVPPGKKGFLEEIVGTHLRQGIKIGNRLYEVLASSNSQLREHGLWMWARDKNNNTASEIRAWMGDFTKIHNVAKYMARMGQCFTSSEEAAQVPVDEDDEITLQEVKTEDGKYTFSDGVGMISTELAKEVRHVLEGKMDITMCLNAVYKPSAFQIRYKGCKGMVAEMPFCEGIALGIRPSMRKFECDTSNNLEIVKTSAPRPLFLNRPLITILEQLGVSEKVFLGLQKSAILELTDSLLYEDKAARIMTNMLLLDFPFKKLQKAGILLTEEPFFRVLLLAVYKSAVDNLRSKARIPVPPEYGRNMLGLLDETKSLKYGQVFVQYSESVERNVTSALHVRKGPVVVTKNPCMHPGDVRLLEAVDVHQLHHIKDCIVFPAQGPRPHPDEMAGSDLDGDEYVVIWMPELMFTKNYEPMEYPPSHEKVIDRTIEVDDMIDFFCDYIQNDNIGTFANAHLSWADQHKDGIFSDVCMSISSKYPYVLDFAKTGYTKYLKSSEKPRSYPDFMEKGVSSDNYRSRRALGTLYRTSRVLEACIGKIDLNKYVSKIDSYLDYPGWEEYEEWARDLSQDYTNRVTNMLNKYGIQSETEALSGYVEKVSLFSQSRNEKSNAISIVKTYITETMTRFKYKFLEALDRDFMHQDLSEIEKKTVKFRRASAWYMVVYQQECPRVLSFPWILSDVLIEIKNEFLKISEVPALASGSSFLDDLDKNLYALFQMATELCSCVFVGKNILFEWMSKADLNFTAVGSGACIECVTRIFEYFMTSSDTSCCSGKQWECSCAAYCSPAKFVMSCLKFFVANASKDVGQCRSCVGFRPFNLCSLALQTYADLAISHDKKYLGFEDNDSVALQDATLDEEGDPIRIPVNDQDLEKLMTNHMVEVTALLKQMSGVKEIFISGNKRFGGQWFIVVNSVGRCWQRWNLEELIMSPELSKCLQRKMSQFQRNGRP